MREPFASEKLEKLEQKERYVRERYGDSYYEKRHNQYQKEADFEGLMMCISIALILMMFCAYMNH